MKLSVITAVYNRKDTIVDCLRSLASQTYSDYEHIIIDNQSSDGTSDIISKNMSEKTKHFIEYDDGIYDAINKGINVAQGEYIMLLHSDDILLNNALSIIFDQIKNSEYDAVFFEVDVISSRLKRRFLTRFFHPNLLKFGIMPAHTGAIIKRKVFTEIGLYDNSLKISADFEFFIRFFTLRKTRIKYKILPISITRMQAGGASNGSLQKYIDVTDELHKSLKQNGVKSFRFFLHFRILHRILGITFLR